MSSFLCSLLVLSLWSLLLCSTAGQAPAVAFTYFSDTPDPYRGLACAAPRVYPYNTNSWLRMFTQGSFLNETYPSEQYINNGLWGWMSNAWPAGNISGREGSFFHFSLYPDQSNVAMFIGGGRTQDISGSVVPPSYRIVNGSVWQQWAPGPTDPVLPPVSLLSWNYTYAPVVDTLYDDSYVTVLYGGWVVDPSLNNTGYIDNNFYVVETSPLAPKPISLGVATPFAMARLGVAMASFNATSTNSSIRGSFVVIGGLAWPANEYFSDVLVSTSPRADGNWTRFPDAPFAGRYGAQAFDGGRQSIFIYGGFTLNGRGTFLQDIWYGQFGAIPSDPNSPPVWTSITTSGTYPGPNYQPGCSMAWWIDSRRLVLMMLGAHTDTLVHTNATSEGWLGQVTWPATTIDPSEPQ